MINEDFYNYWIKETDNFKSITRSVQVNRRQGSTYILEKSFRFTNGDHSKKMDAYVKAKEYVMTKLIKEECKKQLEISDSVILSKNYVEHILKKL